MKTHKYKHIILSAISWAVITYCYISFITKMIFNLNLVGKVKTIILWEEGGYGHTLTGVDIARRLYGADGPVVVFYGFCHGRHNPYVPKIWHDILLEWFSLSVRIGHHIFHMPYSHRIKLCRRMKLALSYLVPSKRVMLGSDVLNDLSHKAGFGCSENDWVCTYYKIIRENTSFPPPVLNKTDYILAQNVENPFLDDIAERKICTLYLRDKSDGGALVSSARNGSPLDTWLAAVALLRDRGYRVLLVGDRDLPPDWSLTFGPSTVIDYSAARMDKALFSLLAVSICDIFIGENGGGVWQAALSSKPCLIVNAFPMRNGFPNSTLYYKSVIDCSTNQSLTALQLFDKFPISDEILSGPFYRLVENSSEELIAAIKDFLDHQDTTTYQSPRDLLAHLPPSNWLHFTNCRISQPWLDKFYRPE